MCAGWSFFMLLVLASCIPQEELTPTHISVPTITPASSSAPFSPITAEEVVYAFLTSYEDNPDAMIPFLSKRLQETLPAGGVLTLLDIQGTIEGLVFTSGTSSDSPNEAIVEAVLQVNGAETVRIFYLERELQRWVIRAIEQP